MDSVSQQAATIRREGDPSKPRPKNAEVQADATDSVKANEDKSKNTSGDSDKKKGAKRQSDGGKVKKDKSKSKKKKKKPDPSDSSESSEGGDDSSVLDSDAAEPKIVPAQKRSTKKGLDTEKLKAQTNKKTKTPLTTKVQPSAASESDWDSSDSESDSDDEVDQTDPVVDARKCKNKGSGQDLSYLVAIELQRLLQQAHSQPPPPQVAPGHANLGNSLGAAADSGAGGGLAALGYPQAGRVAWSNYPNMAAGRGRIGRSQPSWAAAMTDTVDDAAGDGSLLGSRGRRPESSQVAKKHLGGAAAQGKKRSKKLDYKRVDQVWDTSIHNFKLQDTAESVSETKYDGFCFHVRRTFDWEGKYKATVVDIKSKILRECLQDVIGNIKGVSLVDETPKLDPNVLFLYLEDLRKHVKKLKKEAASPSGADKRERKEQARQLGEKRQHLKVLVKYIDKDYDQIKKSLYPMLEHGLITFDLLWALWKPNTLAYTTTYGSHDEPRVFKVDTAEKHYHLSKGEFYYVDGKYFEYDGKQFGHGHMVEEIGEFRGAKKITSFSCYPLSYHKHEEKVRRDLIERGKKFVTLSGVNYRSHHGMAYYKKKKVCFMP